MDWDDFSMFKFVRKIPRVIDSLKIIVNGSEIKVSGASIISQVRGKVQ